MSNIEIEFTNKEEKKLSLPLWLADKDELYQVLCIEDKKYILVDPLDTQENISYIYYNSVKEIIDDYPALKQVNIKIVVS